jgi:uncharacterized membrane protein
MAFIEGLFAVAYPDETSAKEALQLLANLNAKKELKLRNAAVIVRNAEGVYRIAETHDVLLAAKRSGGAGIAGGVMASVGAAPMGPLAPLMASLLTATGAAAGLGLSVLQDLGFHMTFVRNIEARMQPGTSAVVAVVNFSQPEATLMELGQLPGGKILEHPFSPEVYERLAGYLENQ